MSGCIRPRLHSVTNPLPRFTGGIHIYGGDFFATPRSQWHPETLAEEPSDGARIRAIAPGVVPEVAAAAAKLMSNKDLVLVGRKVRVVTRCRNTMGEEGTFGVRVQPNHPRDDLAGILLSAAVIPYVDRCYLTLAQDWPRWLETGA